jgi:hypothetical protein
MAPYLNFLLTLSELTGSRDCDFDSGFVRTLPKRKKSRRSIRGTLTRGTLGRLARHFIGTIRSNRISVSHRVEHRISTTQGASGVALGLNNKGEVIDSTFQGEDYQAFLYSSSGGHTAPVQPQSQKTSLPSTTAAAARR